MCQAELKGVFAFWLWFRPRFHFTETIFKVHTRYQYHTFFLFDSKPSLNLPLNYELQNCIRTCKCIADPMKQPHMPFLVLYVFLLRRCFLLFKGSVFLQKPEHFFMRHYTNLYLSMMCTIFALEQIFFDRLSYKIRYPLWW